MLLKPVWTEDFYAAVVTYQSSLINKQSLKPFLFVEVVKKEDVFILTKVVSFLSTTICAHL